MHSTSYIRRALLPLVALAVIAVVSACSPTGTANPVESPTSSVSVAVMSCTASPYCVAGNEAME